MEDFELVYFNGIEGINFPFVLAIPKYINPDGSLILNGSTPGGGFNNYKDALEDATFVVRNGYFSPIYKELSQEFGNPMLLPIIPRCDNGLYPGYLGYDTYHENFNNIPNTFSEEEKNKFKKLDEQIVKMIEYSINYLNETYNLEYDNRVIGTGYSASSKMVNHFAALHPENVRMVIGGGTGGLCINPTKEYDYPLGFKDLPLENLEEFKSIPQFYYIGMEDTLDPSRPAFERIPLRDELGNFVLDNNGNVEFKRDERGNFIPAKDKNGKIKFIKDENNKYILPKGGFYSEEQTEIIINVLGENTQERFDKNMNEYLKNGVNVRFEKYNGNHDINDSRLSDDIKNFYLDNRLKSNNNYKAL